MLTNLAVTYVRRMKLHPCEDIMAKDMVFMLSKRSYRDWFQTLPSTKLVDEKLRTCGVSEQWDSPTYDLKYRLDDLSASAYPTYQEYALSVIRSIIGYKDEEKRKYVPGKGLADLKNGKKSVTLYVKENAGDIALLKEGRLSKEGAEMLLENLQSFVVSSTSKTYGLLSRSLEQIREELFLSPGEVRAKVWDRNPWVDLTAQTEFYSSAALRGTKYYDGGVRGRLAPFSYLRNKSISAMDFSTGKGRVVRARLAAAVTKNSKGRSVSVLYVDGVEGSNTLDVKVVKKALEDFALKTGFQLVAYNMNVHNLVPRRFAEFVKRQNDGCESMLDIAYVDSSFPEYLDSFGLPLDPFEYQYPKGRVVAYVKKCAEYVDWEAKPPFVYEKVRQHIRCNVPTYFSATTGALAGALLYLFDPITLLPYGAIVGCVLAAHLGVKYRSKFLSKNDKGASQKDT